MVPDMVGYSDSARGMRLRLRFDDRELVVEERSSSVTYGRADENDVVVKGHLSSRLHARIVIGRSNGRQRNRRVEINLTPMQQG